MIDTIVNQKINQIHLYTKRLMQVNLLGNARSSVKGTGIEFDQLRDYQIGDDVRALDWNSSARMNKLLVKQFIDEKRRTLILALDISASSFFGSDKHIKYDVISHIAGIISYAAYLSNDEVALILFDSEVQVYIPPAKGRSHTHLILKRIFSAKNGNSSTNINCMLEFVMRLRKKNAMLVLISDFIDTELDSKINIVNRIYDLIAVRVNDAFEKYLPVNALFTVRDFETDQECIIDSRNYIKNSLNIFLKDRLENQTKYFMNNNITVFDIKNSVVLLDQIIHFFKTRSYR